MTEDQKAILDKVVDNIKKLTPEEFKARLEKYKNHDIAIALRELDEFSKFVENHSGLIQKE